MQLANPDLLVSDAWVDGQAVPGRQRFPVADPATGLELARVTDCTLDLTQAAIESCSSAFQTWRQVCPRERHQLLLRWADQLAANHDDLAAIICHESGKVLAQAHGEISHCITMLRWYAEECRRLTGTLLPKHHAGQQNYTICQPIGVVACITPWNFPAAAVTVKAGAAIAAGCSCILKPSEYTPLIALALARLATVAGIPKGVFNVVCAADPADIGNQFCQSSSLAMLSFTGSSAVGKSLYQQCGSTLKKLAMELGGNAPFVIFDDCDLGIAVRAVIAARFYNSGQICVGANRIFIQNTIYQPFAEQLATEVNKLKVANGFEPDSDLGPLINHRAKARLHHLVTDALAKGGRLLAGEANLASSDDLFFQPTVIADMSAAMQAYRKEIFGPIACLYSFTDEADAIAQANDTDAGLAAYVFSGNYPRLIRLSEQLQAGSVGANSTDLFCEDTPFGGVKQSGFGKEQGLHCLEEFTLTKTIALGLIP